MAVGDQPVFNGRKDGWLPTDESEALAVLDEAGDYCSGRCPIFETCVEAECLVYRLENVAHDFVTGGSASAVGVLDEPSIGIV